MSTVFQGDNLNDILEVLVGKCADFFYKEDFQLLERGDGTFGWLTGTFVTRFLTYF
jgi:hypothetical protein